MATRNLANIASGNGLLPDGTKPLPELMLTYYQWGLVQLRAISLDTWAISY